MVSVRGLIVYNPTAGPRDVKRELRRVRRELTRRGWSVDIETTQDRGEVTLVAGEAARARLDAVWVAGGDGTVGEAVNGLVGSQTALGVLPVGTGNLWARQLRLPVYTLANPFRLREAAVAQAEGKVRTVDVGRLNDRYFLLWSGIGFDAQVTAELEPRARRTKRLGAIPYAIAAVALARHFSGVRTRVVVDGRAVRSRTLLIVVSNIQMYVFFPLARHARLDDGLLDVFVFKGLGLPYIVRHAVKVFSGRHLEDPRVVQRRGRQITVWTEVPMAVQADGDPVGTTPVSLSVVPRTLRILVPPQAPATLFSVEEP